jgi:AcrR family transcriptional regulator
MNNAARRTRSRRGEGEQLRDEIIATASRMLGETGNVADLSLRAVARAVGVAATSIYLHFRNLDELIAAVKIRYLEEFGAALTAAADVAGADPWARSRARAHRYVSYGLEHRGRYFVMFSASMIMGPLKETVSAVGNAVFESVRADVTTLVGDAADSHLLAVHFWTALHGIVTLRSVRPLFDWPDLTTEIDDLLDYLMPDRLEVAQTRADRARSGGTPRRSAATTGRPAR